MIPSVYELCRGSGRLFSIKTDKFKFSSLTVLIKVPEGLNNTAYNNLLLSVLQRGTRRHGTVGEINKYLDSLYSMNACARRYSVSDNHFIGVSCEFLDERFVYDGLDLERSALAFARELLFEPLLDENGLLLEEYIAAEKVNIINSLKAQRNDPKGYASIRCREQMRAGERGAMTLEQLILATEEITAKDLTAYYDRITEEKCFVAFYIGNRTDAVLDGIGEVLPEGKTQVCLPKNMPLNRHSIDREVVRGAEALPVQQSKLAVGYRTDIVGSDTDETEGAADIYSMQVLCEIFGGSPASKLFANIREKMGICYYCSAAYSFYSGVIMVNAGVDPDKRELVETCIDRELDDIANGNITEAELNAAKLSLKFGYSMISDSVTSLENFYLGRWLVMSGITAEDVIDGVMKVTVGDVVRVARRLKKTSVFCVEGVPATEGNATGDANYLD